MAGRGQSDDARGVAAKLFAIADAFDEGRPLTLTQIARRAELPVSTASRLLAEWVRWGGVVRDEQGRYEIGMKLWRLGVRRPSTRRLRGAALPYLEELMESTREHVHLAVREELAAVYVERLSAHDAVPVISDVGSRLPLHATGVGMALLAYAPSSVFDQVIEGGPRKYLPNTVTDERRLRARLAEVRATGIARTVEEMTAGTFSVAAPVRDGSGTVVAAVSVIAHAARRDEPQFALGVRMAARGISSALGWRPES